MHRSSGVIGSAEKYSAAEIRILFGGWLLAARAIFFLADFRRHHKIRLRSAAAEGYTLY